MSLGDCTNRELGSAVSQRTNCQPSLRFEYLPHWTNVPLTSILVATSASLDSMWDPSGCARERDPATIRACGAHPGIVPGPHKNHTDAVANRIGGAFAQVKM